MEAPDLFLGSYFGAGECHFSSSENRYFDQKPIDNNARNQFTIDDLLDFSKEEDEVMIDDAFLHNLNAGPVTGNHSAHSSTVTVTDSCNSSNSAGEPHLSPSGGRHYSFASHFSSNDNELCVPYDDLAELEWLSNFVVEESFSSDDLQNLQLISATKTPTDTSSSVVSIRNTTSLPTTIFPSDVSVQGKARSKRSRASRCDWSSRLLILCPTTSSSENNDNNIKKAADEVEASGRKCLHCGSEKTPQWRTGPMGPKTLCNACGVRYKSGRLLPEYRPAASPTFVLTKHSNSHRKVMELRRQKELQREQEQEQLLSQSSVFGDDYLIHCQNGAAFRHMI